MDYKAFQERISSVPYPDTIEYSPAFIWVNSGRLPKMLVNIGKEASGIIRIPDTALNCLGRPVGVISMSRHAFAGKDKVTDIVLPASIGSIPAGSFAGCTELRRLTIPANIRRFRAGTFAGCDKLEDIYYEGSLQEWQEIEIITHRHEVTFGKQIPGRPVDEVLDDSLVPVPGNEALFRAQIHFCCELEGSDTTYSFEIKTGGSDVTNLFRVSNI